MNRFSSLAALCAALLALALLFGCPGPLPDDSGASGCGSGMMAIPTGCCYDIDDDGICDDAQSGGNVSGTGSGAEAPNLSVSTDMDTQCRDIALVGLESDTTPTFGWVLPLESEGIKGYWVKIDSGEWQLVDPPASNTAWESPVELADGTHEFSVRAEYSTRMYGVTASTYFKINTAFPDFVVTEIRVGPVVSHLDSGITLYYVSSLYATIKNQGGAFKKSALPNGQSLKNLALYIDGKQSSSPTTDWVDSLGAGEEIELQFMLYGGTPTPEMFISTEKGSHEIKVKVNIYNEVEETDYSNNEATTTVTIE